MTLPGPRGRGRTRILFLNNQGSGAIGGGGTILRHLLADLAPDHDVTLASLDGPASEDGPHRLHLPAPPSPGRLWPLAPLLRARHLARVLPREAIAAADLVVTLDCHFATALRRTRPKRLLHLSLSCTAHQEFVTHRGAHAGAVFLQYAWLERALLARAGAVVLASRAHAAEMQAWLRPRDWRPVILHPAFPGPALPPLAPHAGPLTVLAAGRLVRGKNFAAVLDIAARLTDLECRFVIAGDGPELPALRAQAAALGLAGRVEFPGAVPDITPLLAQADLLLHPSPHESFGIVVFEAMRAGRPVVCADAAAAVGYGEIVTDGLDACRVDFARLDLAAAAVRRLLNEPAARAAMGAAAARTAARLLATEYVSSFRGIAARLLQTAPA